MILSPETLMQLFGYKEEDLDCAGLKLHLDRVFVIKTKGVLLMNKKQLPEYEEIQPNEYSQFVLPEGVYKIRYKEYVKIPEDTIALAVPRSTLLRMGVALYTAVWDPGYEGRGEGLMVVFNKNGVVIERYTQIAQLVFFRFDRATRFLYRGSYYRENI